MEMKLAENFFKETEAEFKKYRKGEMIVDEDTVLHFFYYLKKGEIGIHNSSEEGKVFLHHRVSENNFFGEPLTLTEIAFPGYISVMSESAEVYKIRRNTLLGYLTKHPEWCVDFLMSVAEKSLKKSELLRNIIFLNPEERIIKHFHELKGEKTEKTLMEVTRKELSMMTGLRIETIIRTIKRMEKEGKVEIINGKVYF